MQRRSIRRVVGALLAGALFATAASSQLPSKQPPAAAPPTATMSLSGEKVFAFARSRLLQIRTLVTAANRQSSIGSGFFMSADGLVITNYHVVSQFALEPKTYTLEYIAPDGTKGPLKLLAIDVANDLAVVKVDKTGFDFFELDQRAVDGTMPKGERLYSMGNPLDLGFTIVEGTYNGLVDKSYDDQVHFSGAINPGMSGGPTTTGEGRVAGINVARRLDGELVSFLVPARYAHALLTRARGGAVLEMSRARVEIGRQLEAWQARFYRDTLEKGFKPSTFGPYQAAESGAPWFQCWASTNSDQFPKARAHVNTTQCYAQTSIFVAGDLRTGTMQFSHSYLQSVDLNEFQFATFASQQYRSGRYGGYFDRKRLTPQECIDEFIRPAAEGKGPAMRTRICARAYRDFEGLYDVSVIAFTQDRGLEGLVSNLSMRGITWENAMTLARRFLAEIQWAK
jgi:serine protease Do